MSEFARPAPSLRDRALATRAARSDAAAGRAARLLRRRAARDRCGARRARAARPAGLRAPRRSSTISRSCGELEAEGAIFVEELDEVPAGAVVIFSAHGVAPRIAADAEQRGLTAYDAVCPLVAKVHRQVERYHREGRQIVLVGHRGHPEIEGTIGHVPPGAASLVVEPPRTSPRLTSTTARRPPYAVQTTYSVDEAARSASTALRARFADLAEPADQRHLLRDHQPPARGPDDRRAGRCGDRRRRSLLLQRLPPGRSRGRQLRSRCSWSPTPRELDWSRAAALRHRSGSPPPPRRRRAASRGIVDALAGRYRLRIEEVGRDRGDHRLQAGRDRMSAADLALRRRSASAADLGATIDRAVRAILCRSARRSRAPALPGDALCGDRRRQEAAAAAGRRRGRPVRRAPRAGRCAPASRSSASTSIR